MTTRRNRSNRARFVGFGGAVLLFALSILLPLALFFWYAETLIARIEPTPYNTFGYGFFHGLFAVPSWLYSLINDQVTIYQFPNEGADYNFGFLIGVLLSLSGPKLTIRFFRTRS